ncbi:MAG TPA: class I SAM-dependent rRNA methyltransferase [Verrucomicrobiae bacterium]|nr:class I SAM-dependent rRNA methyltransferase [Verrucomicrobiae bacterium]
MRSRETNAFRLIHGAADGFPEITVDRYACVLVANLYGAAQTKEPMPLLKVLAERCKASAVYLKYRPKQASVLKGAERESHAPSAPFWGEPVPELEILENGMRFLIRPGEGLSTGLFLDMREIRNKIRRLSAGRTVLNCFSYTCGFGVAAVLGGAARALNIDLSGRYLEWGKRNMRCNGLEAQDRDFVTGDVFDWLQRFGRRQERFQSVILDPPTYATGPSSRFVAQRDYEKLVSLAAPVVEPRGVLWVCNNSHQLSRQSFLNQVRKGIAAFPARIQDFFNEPAADFPKQPVEESYLKVCAVKFG